MSIINLVNNDSVNASIGDIVQSSGQDYGVVRSVANSQTISLLGVWRDGPGVGGVGRVGNEVEEVNCSVSVNIGDRLFLDPLIPGKATNIAPAYPYFLGTVLEKRTLGVQKATIGWKGAGIQITSAEITSIVGAAASGSIICTAVSTISDNNGFGLSDGTTLVNFEYKKTQGTVYATGSITTVAKASISNNNNFTLNDGVHAATTFEYKVVAAGFVPTGGGVIVIDVTSGTITTAANVATATQPYINAASATLAITAGTVTSATIPLTNNAYGPYNTAITGTAGFTFVGMTGGVGFVPTAGYITMNLLGSVSAQDVANATYTSIIAQSLNLVVAPPTTSTVYLANNTVGVLGNVTITKTGGCPLTVAGMSGGVNSLITSGLALLKGAYPTTDVNVASYTVNVADILLQVRRTSSGACSITLPAISSVPSGRTVIIKDSEYNATTNHITINSTGTDKIENAASPYVISVSGTALWISSNSITNNWEID